VQAIFVGIKPWILFPRMHFCSDISMPIIKLVKDFVFSLVPNLICNYWKILKIFLDKSWDWEKVIGIGML